MPAGCGTAGQHQHVQRDTECYHDDPDRMHNANALPKITECEQNNPVYLQKNRQRGSSSRWATALEQVYTLPARASTRLAATCPAGASRSMLMVTNNTSAA